MSNTPRPRAIQYYAVPSTKAQGCVVRESQVDFLSVMPVHRSCCVLKAIMSVVDKAFNN